MVRSPEQILADLKIETNQNIVKNYENSVWEVTNSVSQINDIVGKNVKEVDGNMVLSKEVWDQMWHFLLTLRNHSGWDKLSKYETSYITKIQNDKELLKKLS